jgi:hypothetical protein
MICDVILTKEKDKYIARVKDWPDVVVEERSRDRAITSVKSRLVDYLTKEVELIQVEVPLPGKTGNPWLDKFGWFKDDPTFDDLQAEIASFRRKQDQEMEQTNSDVIIYTEEKNAKCQTTFNRI